VIQLLRILLTNDDGVFAPGLRALRKELMRIGDVTVIAPAIEQSGVGHSITFLSPLIVKEVEDEDGSTLGWMVEGSPADSVKLAICELMPRPPDLIVSGINAGANAGINVLYSGTVAAAIEGAFFKITSIAVSLELADHFDYPQAARQSAYVIEQILAQRPAQGSLFNVNLPAMTRGEPRGIRVVPMGVGRHGEGFERRMDPRGRTYYWMTYSPPFQLEGPETDVTSLSEGYITVTPLHFNMTRTDQLADLSRWNWGEAPTRPNASNRQHPTGQETPP
jgi:5'-nucleotidase